MNTKQLWNALIKNKVTEPFFAGIFPRDMLTIIENKPQLIICNTDPSFKKGEHWLLFYFDKNVVKFYDPLGKTIMFYGNEFSELINKFGNEYKFSKIRTQPIKSNYVENTVCIMLTVGVRVIQWNILLKVCHLHAKL